MAVMLASHGYSSFWLQRELVYSNSDQNVLGVQLSQNLSSDTRLVPKGLMQQYAEPFAISPNYCNYISAKQERIMIQM